MNEEIDLEASNGMDGVQPGNGNNAGQGASGRTSCKSQVSHAKINAQKESFWHEKPRLPCNKQLTAHIAIIATKSIYFQQIFLDKIAKKTRKDEKLIIDFNG